MDQWPIGIAPFFRSRQVLEEGTSKALRLLTVLAFVSKKYYRFLLAKNQEKSDNKRIMDKSSPFPRRKRVSRANISTTDPETEAVLEEVRQLRATIAVYRKVVDRLIEKKVA